MISRVVQHRCRRYWQFYIFLLCLIVGTYFWTGFDMRRVGTGLALIEEEDIENPLLDTEDVSKTNHRGGIKLKVKKGANKVGGKVSLKGNRDKLDIEDGGDENVEPVHNDVHDQPSTFVEMVKRHASPEKVIILAGVDSAFVEMGINFYLTSLQPLGITNYLFVASDSHCCTVLSPMNINCFVYKEIGTAGKASQFGSRDFIAKMNIRTEMILEALDAGYDVLHSDTDIVFQSDPVSDIRGKYCTGCDIAVLMDTKGIYNAGFIYVRNTKFGHKVYEGMRRMSIKNPKIDDQRQLRMVMDEIRNSPAGSGFKLVKLPDDKYLSGMRYFEQGRTYAGDNPCGERCIVIHNNWIVSKAAKVYRFKEHHMWLVDGEHRYYTCPLRKYILYDNPLRLGDPSETLAQERKALESALAIGSILNRTVILPEFHCSQRKQLNKPCALNSKYRISIFDGIYGNMYREHMFLSHSMVQQRTRESLSDKYFIASDYAQSQKPKESLDGNIKVLQPGEKSGATSDDIRTWFDGIDDKILQFHSLYQAFSTFKSKDRQRIFEEQNKAAFKKAVYRQY